MSGLEPMLPGLGEHGWLYRPEKREFLRVSVITKPKGNRRRYRDVKTGAEIDGVYENYGRTKLEAVEAALFPFSLTTYDQEGSFRNLKNAARDFVAAEQAAANAEAGYDPIAMGA